MAERRSLHVARSQVLSARLLRFALVGGATSVAFALAVAALVDAAAVSPAIAAALAYLGLLPVNYVGHRRATWRSQAPRRPEVIRFLCVHGLTMATCTVVMAAVTGPMGQPHWAGSLVIVVFAPVMNFALFDRWVFRSRAG